jgi:hypothetical protein
VRRHVQWRCDLFEGHFLLGSQVKRELSFAVVVCAIVAGGAVWLSLGSRTPSSPAGYGHETVLDSPGPGMDRGATEEQGGLLLEESRQPQRADGQLTDDDRAPIPVDVASATESDIPTAGGISGGDRITPQSKEAEALIWSALAQSRTTFTNIDSVECEGKVPVCEIQYIGVRDDERAGELMSDVQRSTLDAFGRPFFWQGSLSSREKYPGVAVNILTLSAEPYRGRTVEEPPTSADTR